MSNTVINCFRKAGFISDRFPEVEELHDENQQPEAGVNFDGDYLSTSEPLFENQIESPDDEKIMVFVVENQDE